MSAKKPLKMLTEEQLLKLNAQRIMGVLHSARAVKSSLYKQIAEAGGNDLELEAKAHTVATYFKLVKSIADTHKNL